MVLKKHSQTLQNFHLHLTSHLHLTHWRKTKDYNIQKVPPRCTETARPQPCGELLLAPVFNSYRCLPPQFYYFFFKCFFFSPNHLRLCPGAPSSASPSKTPACTYKHPHSCSATQPRVPARQEKHHPTLLQDAACALKTGEDDGESHMPMYKCTPTCACTWHSFPLAKCPVAQTKGTLCISGQVLNEAGL